MHHRWTSQSWSDLLSELSDPLSELSDLLPFPSRPDWLQTLADVRLSADQPWRSYGRPVSELGLVLAVSRDTRAIYPRGYTPDHR